MKTEFNRRDFIKLTAAGGAICFAAPNLLVYGANPEDSLPISPGCRKSKVKLAVLYMAIENNRYWPKPQLDLKKEVRFYQNRFAELKSRLSDVDFTIDELVTSTEKVANLSDKLKKADGILAIHLTMGINDILREILKQKNYTIVFAIPYSGREWTGFGNLMKEPIGDKMDCILSSDYKKLSAAVRPFRAVHHLKHAKILNVTERESRMPSKYVSDIREQFGTEIKNIPLDRLIAAYNNIEHKTARDEAHHWIGKAQKVIEPSREEIVKSAQMALAIEKILNEEQATVFTVDCYGSMFEPLCQAYAYPCLGFSRLNNIGYGGICESDLKSAMTHIIFQGLSGKPGFISDPTIDESKNSAVLAHCLGTPKMDGPHGPAAPYKLRSVMERREGVVTQVKMRVGQKVTQARLIGTDLLLYFTGDIIETPVSLEDDRGCRTKITVKVDGDAGKLWKNWSHGLHRVTCYGDITEDLERFCRFKKIKRINEAV